MYAAREGSQKLQALEPNDRADIINSLANLLLDRQEDILAANKRDIDIAKEQGKDFKHVSQRMLRMLAECYFNGAR